MKHNLDIVDELYATLNTLQPLEPEDKSRLDKKFRLEFNYNSNHIEGNTLTYGETELLLLFDDTIGNHSMREYEETKAHDIAFRFVEELAKDIERPLTEQIIKNLNEVILVRPYWKDALTPDGQNTRREIKVGNYKEYPNSVRLQNGEIFEYASPVETPILMQELINWFRDEEHALHPVTLATILHYKFVRIHPFDDGNGRLSRLLMNYVLLKNNYPPVIIKSSDKNNYLRALHLADIGDYGPLINYVAEQVVWSLKTAIKAARGESLEDEDDFVKEIELIKRKASSKNIPKSPGIVYNTFKLIDTKLWNTVLNTLTYFDTLFNETKNIHSVNNLDEQFETRYVSNFELKGILGRTEISDEPKKTKIFGHDVYTWDIYTISWEHIMYALQGAETPIDLRIRLEANFNNHNYTIQLKIYSSIIYETVKAYKDVFLATEIDEITHALKKHLIEFIKEKVN
ncbi:Fic family protein [Mucilaginibacter gotjawali]|uniref:Fic family protein n=2 Tax=Mucilaginibacter gotjawali TaxID=1550579 RepID=A0A839SF59_9SPHI|nr:Fic family protein [Mucilaginibacter gotjawali]MBB3055914.1 Fic family protein [Mucilaginibacter gotjawali]BAU54737.1 Adenosine monophosphate-protein transferase and cysteine protease IbpA precursor [Mucilaginibacter gotjawali]